MIYSMACSSQRDSVQLYDWKPTLDVGLLFAGSALNAYFLIEEPNQPRLDTDEIFNLTRDEVSSWELDATYNWNESAEKASDYIQTLAILSPLALMASPEIRNDALKIGVLAAETMLLNQGITGALKINTNRKRPFVYNENAPIDYKYRRQVFYSFPSAHTSASAAAAFFTAKVYSDYFPDSKWKKWIWAGAVTIPAFTGYLRYEAGRHYITDIIAGYSIGATLGILIPTIHKNEKHGFNMQLISLGSGVAMQFRWDMNRW